MQWAQHFTVGARSFSAFARDNTRSHCNDLFLYKNERGLRYLYRGLRYLYRGLRYLYRGLRYLYGHCSRPQDNFKVHLSSYLKSLRSFKFTTIFPTKLALNTKQDNVPSE